MLRTVDWIADMEHAAVRADLGLTWVLLVLSVALLCIFAIIRLKRKIWLLLPALLSAAAMLVPIAAYHLPSEDGVRMDCYVSSSGMTLLFSDRGRAVAVDFSGGASENATLLVNGMREQGCTTLADLVICKETNRSPAFLSSVSQRVRIDRVHLGEGGGPTERAVRARLSEEAVAHSIEVVPALTAFKIESLELVRLHCLRNAREEIEGQLLLLRCEGVRIAYVSGHVPITQLERTLAEQLVQTDLLLVGADAFPASDQLLPRTEATEILLEKKELAMRLPSYGRETTVFGGMGSRSYRLKSSRFSSVDERLLFIFC